MQDAFPHESVGGLEKMKSVVVVNALTVLVWQYEGHLCWAVKSTDCTYWFSFLDMQVLLRKKIN